MTQKGDNDYWWKTKTESETRSVAKESKEETWNKGMNVVYTWTVIVSIDYIPIIIGIIIVIPF